MTVNMEIYRKYVVAVILLVSLTSFPSSSTALSIRNRFKRDSPVEGPEDVLVVTEPETNDSSVSKMDNVEPIPPEIYSFRVQSDIKYRYSRTLVTSRVANKDPNQAQEVTFSVILPETAFISKFVMEIDGIPYEAYVKEKEEAKRDYVQAQKQGQSAGLVEKSTRNSNMLNVNVHVKQQTKVTFNLTYEELLVRKLGHYEQAISISPDQITSVNDYQIIVNVEESRDLTFVRVPSLSNDIDAQDDQGNNPNAIVERTPKSAKISWSPSSTDQRKLRKEGNSGKFIVQYDVDRESDAGQILLMQGYFVHFFAPKQLPPLRKHVVFILDISGSMHGRRIEQLKESQVKILDDLSADDYFNIITFSSEVDIWIPKGERRDQPLPVTPENVEKAKDFINALVATGGTNIHGALTKALSLIGEIKEAQQMAHTKDASPASSGQVVLPANVQPLIMFLTDGEPSTGITSLPEIQSGVRSANKALSIPIYSLAFGEGADLSFLKRLSLQNNGFARKIYEASDAALQLEGFYAEISSPFLSNVTFNYTSDEYNVTDLTVTRFPTAFGGAEITVAGKFVAPPKMIAVDVDNNPTVGCNLAQLGSGYFDVNVEGIGRDGEVALNQVEVYGRPPWCEINNDLSIHPVTPSTPEDNFLERLWVYLTISQLIEKDSSTVQGSPSGDENALAPNGAGTETPKEKALRLALKYGFVTPLTSLVVVKPNSSDITNAVPFDGRAGSQSWGSGHRYYGIGSVGGPLYFDSSCCGQMTYKYKVANKFCLVDQINYIPEKDSSSDKPIYTTSSSA